MERIIGMIALLLAVATYGCGGNPAGPDPTPKQVPATTKMYIQQISASYGDNPATGTGGTAIPPTVSEESGVRKYTFVTPPQSIHVKVSMFNPEADGRSFMVTILCDGVKEWGGNTFSQEFGPGNPATNIYPLSPATPKGYNPRNCEARLVEQGGNLPAPAESKALFIFIAQ